MRDSKYVVLVIDDALDRGSGASLTAHELLAAGRAEAQGSPSAADMCHDALEPRGRVADASKALGLPLGVSDHRTGN